MDGRFLTKKDLERDRVSLLKEAEEYHRKWLTALGAIDFIDYQLKTFDWKEEGASAASRSA